MGLKTDNIEKSNIIIGMKKIKNVTRGVMTAIALFCMSLSAQAAEVVYKIVEYNKTTQDFLLAASGMVPKNS